MTAEAVLDIARAELGVKESPKGSNNVKYNTWYYGREVAGNYPWCMAFVQWVFSRAGITPPVRTASCGALMRAAKTAGEWVTEGYRPGDVIIYDFPGGAATDHTGICESAAADGVTCIEGNTSVSNASNGGEVRRMRRKMNTVKGAWRPNYEEDDDMTQDRFDEMMADYLGRLGQTEPSDWSREDREWAEGIGLIRGDEHGNKQYKAFTTRESMVTFLRRMYEILK